MKKFVEKGSEQSIIRQIEKMGFNKCESEKIFNFINSNKCLLSDNESIKKSLHSDDCNPGIIKYMIPNLNYDYYINLKYSTIMIAALLLDIKYTKGFSTLALNLSKVNTPHIIKIDEKNGEKCILKETLSLKNKTGTNTLLLPFHGECCNNNYTCKFRNIDKCGCTKENIDEIYKQLTSKGVFKKEGNKYIYQL